MARTKQAAIQQKDQRRAGGGLADAGRRKQRASYARKTCMRPGGGEGRSGVERGREWSKVVERVCLTQTTAFTRRARITRCPEMPREGIDCSANTRNWATRAKGREEHQRSCRFRLSVLDGCLDWEKVSERIRRRMSRRKASPVTNKQPRGGQGRLAMGCLQIGCLQDEASVQLGFLLPLCVYVQQCKLGEAVVTGALSAASSRLRRVEIARNARRDGTDMYMGRTEETEMRVLCLVPRRTVSNRPQHISAGKMREEQCRGPSQSGGSLAVSLSLCRPFPPFDVFSWHGRSYGQPLAGKHCLFWPTTRHRQLARARAAALQRRLRFRSYSQRWSASDVCAQRETCRPTHIVLAYPGRPVPLSVLRQRERARSPAPRRAALGALRHENA